MMDWQKKIFIIFCPLLVLVYFFVQESKKVEVGHRASRNIASDTSAKIKSVQPVKKVARIRKIANLPKKNKHLEILRYRIPQSIEATFEKNESVRLTKGFEFLNNVAALPKERFDSSLGSVIQRTDELIFFRANPGHRYIPVALSRSTNMLYPISSVLHIKGATPEIREGLLKKGFREYYYHPPLKFLSLETKSGEVIKVYNQLRKDGFKVELEVLKPHHRTF